MAEDNFEDVFGDSPIHYDDDEENVVDVSQQQQQQQQQEQQQEQNFEDLFVDSPISYDFTDDEELQLTHELQQQQQQQHQENFDDIFADSPIPYDVSEEEQEEVNESDIDLFDVINDSPFSVSLNCGSADNSIVTVENIDFEDVFNDSPIVFDDQCDEHESDEYPTFMDIDDVAENVLMPDNAIGQAASIEHVFNNRRRRAHLQRIQSGGSAGERQPSLFFTMSPISEDVRRINDFNHSIYSTKYHVQHNFQEYADIFSVEREIDSIFTEVINERTRLADPMDIVTVTINHERLETPIYVSSRKVSFDPQNFLNAIYEVCQSDRTMILNGEMEVIVEITEHLQGGVLPKTPITVEHWRRLRRCIVTLRNVDNRCGFYAIALGLFYTGNPSAAEKRDLRENRRQRLTELTERLCVDLNISLDTPLGVETYSVIDSYLRTKNTRLFVINGTTKNCFFKSSMVSSSEIFLEIYESHYYLITSIEAYTENRHFCRECWVGYSHLNEHRCNLSCEKCHKSVGCSGNDVLCNACNRTFNGTTCYNNHLLSNMCETKKRCNVCEVEYCTRKGHTCGKYSCTKCGDEYEETPHYCFIKRKDLSKLYEEDAQNQIVVCFDIESRIESPVQHENNITRKHVPICLCARVVCNECYSFEINDKRRTSAGQDFCRICKYGTLIYEGENCIKEFGDFLYLCIAKNAEEAKAKLIVLAHNFKGYDGHFIMQDLFNRRFTKVTPIMNGSKILKLTVGNISFIDSFSFLPMALAKLPKVFNFESRALKGYYPYTFNTVQNENYVGPIPAQSYFETSRMMPDELGKFNAWYNRSKEQIYDLKSETRKYCKNDADILMIAVMNFKKVFIETTTINPLTRNFTLASMCLEVFRAKILKDDKTLGVTPINGYFARISSISENAWLDFKQLGYQNIIKRQYKIGKYFADGYVEENGEKIVLEYWGCYFHGCTNCYEPTRILANNETALSLYERVEIKRNYYRARNYNIVEIWECQFNSLCNVSENGYLKERIKHYKTLKKIGGVDIRESFLGGRTNNVRFYYRAAENEEIKYMDVVSLYPTVLKYCSFPVGHPVILNENFDYSLESYVEGFVKCQVLAPFECYMPVLGMRLNNRLLFPLCKMCATEKSTIDCEHSDEERSLVSTFTMPELRCALRKGYKIMKIYQIAHYLRKSNEIFVDYVKMFQKEKQEASGFPSNVQTPEEVTAFLVEFEAHENITLDRAKIEDNPGRRDNAKRSLNGFWGKLSQRPNLPQTVVCSDYTHFWNLLNSDEIEIIGHTFPNESTVIVNYRKQDISDCEEGNTSLAIASYVTAHARLYLYEIMERVISNGYDRLLYYDTDSVIYIHRNGDNDLQTGCYFGQLTDEIEKYGRHAKGVAFVSCGPKNYGIEVNVNGATKTTIKTKGIRYDASSLEIIQLQSMVEMAKKYIEGTIEERRVMQWRIRSNAKDHIVESVEFEKVFRCVSEKRRIIGNGTVPYGFKGNLPYTC